MNTPAKKFNIAVAILAIVCLLLTVMIAVMAYTFWMSGIKNGSADAGTAFSLVFIMILIVIPSIILAASANIVATTMGITMLANIKNRPTSRKSLCVTAAVAEIISAIILMFVNALIATVSPILIINLLFSLLILGIGIVTCVFAACYASEY